MKTVTRWTHPRHDSPLILEGTPEQTRHIASEPGYFGALTGGTDLLQSRQEEWSDEQFAALREFEG